jgi:sec-independent protein translocase protein TatA
MGFSHLPELMLVLVAALIIFGPKRLPEIGSSLGRGIRDFKKGMSDLHAEAVPEALPVPEDHRPAG